jgi:GDSL-like Lipase/Acylhydrolase family
LLTAALALAGARFAAGEAGGETRMNHVVLLGDSIFDNAAYVAGGPDVVAQLRHHLPPGWAASLRAVDGAVTRDVEHQIRGLPPDGSHLVVSVGGNDALGQAGVIEEGARSMAEALARLAAIRDRFATDYRAMLEAVLGHGLPTAVCTIYDPRFPDPQRQRLASTGLTVFNDVITREAFGRGLPLLDLRLICDRPEDYANPIEPSVQGGKKIAAAVTALVAGASYPRPRSEVLA